LNANLVSVGTKQKRFGRKTDGITEFSILDGKWNTQFWMEFRQKMGKWPKDRLKKSSNSFTFIGFTVN